MCGGKKKKKGRSLEVDGGKMAGLGVMENGQSCEKRRKKNPVKTTIIQNDIYVYIYTYMYKG